MEATASRSQRDEVRLVALQDTLRWSTGTGPWAYLAYTKALSDFGHGPSDPDIAKCLSELSSRIKAVDFSTWERPPFELVRELAKLAANNPRGSLADYLCTLAEDGHPLTMKYLIQAGLIRRGFFGRWKRA